MSFVANGGRTNAVISTVSVLFKLLPKVLETIHTTHRFIALRGMKAVVVVDRVCTNEDSGGKLG